MDATTGITELRFLEGDCEQIFALRAKKKEIEETLSFLEKRIKGAFADAGKVDETIGRFNVHIKKTPPTRIVDTNRLKADGLFETYSKEKAGFDSVMVTESKTEEKKSLV